MRGGRHRTYHEGTGVGERAWRLHGVNEIAAVVVGGVNLHGAQCPGILPVPAVLLRLPPDHAAILLPVVNAGRDGKSYALCSCSKIPAERHRSETRFRDCNDTRKSLKHAQSQLTPLLQSPVSLSAARAQTPRTARMAAASG